MPNPAELLYAQIIAWTPQESTAVHQVRGLSGEGGPDAFRRHEIAMGHIAAIRELLFAVKASGTHGALDVYEEAIPMWTAMVLNYANNWTAAGPAFDLAALAHLRTLAPVIHPYVPAVSEENRDALSKAFDELARLLNDDRGVPDELRKYVAAVLAHVRQVLAEYELLGDFELLRAHTLLKAAVDLSAEASTTEDEATQGRWRTLRSKLTWSVAAPAAIEAGSIFTQVMLN